MALISQSDLEDRLQRTLTDEEERAFTLVNSALQAHIERNILGSATEAAVEASRFYDGGVRNLRVDPCTDITAVAWVDEYENVTDTFTTNEYTLEPRNRTLKQMVRYRYGKFPGGFNSIKVTAKFSINGDTDALNIVKDAMLESLVSEVSNNDNIKRESIEGYSIEYATDVTKNNLDKLSQLFADYL